MDNLEDLVPAGKVLAEYSKGFIKPVIETVILPWRAKMDAKAKIINAEADVEVKKILAKGELEVRELSLDTIQESDLVNELINLVESESSEFQGGKRFANKLKAIIRAGQILEGKEVRDHQPNPDMQARFLDGVQDVSSGKLREIWARILAGEIESPGSTSFRTLDTLKNLTQDEAALFERMANYVLNGHFIFYDEQFSKDIQHKSDFGTIDIMNLQECGLLTGGFGLSWTPSLDEKGLHITPYHSTHLLLEKDLNYSQPLFISGAILTKVGKELYRVICSEIQPDYLQDLATYLNYKRCKLYFLKGLEAMPDGSNNYDKAELIEPTPIQPGTPFIF